MSNNVPVRFTKAWRTYFPGDVAGFDAEMAETLIGAGVASAYSAKAVSAVAAVSTAPPSNSGKPVRTAKNTRTSAPKVETASPPVDQLLNTLDPLITLNQGGGNGHSADQPDDGGGSRDGDDGGTEGDGQQDGDDDEKP